MERHSDDSLHDVWDDLFDGIDTSDIDLHTPGTDDQLPPPPDEEGGEPRRRRPPRLPPNNDVVFTPLWTLLAGVIALSMGAVKLLTIYFAGQGGITAVVLITALFALTFLGPFLFGSLWFGRMRRNPH